MATPSTNEFLLRFPEFGEQSLSVIEGALAEAAAITPEDVWGTLQFQAVGHLAAHNLAIRTMQIGQQIGSPSGAAPDKGFAATLYGQSYQTLADTLPLSGFVY